MFEEQVKLIDNIQWKDTEIKFFEISDSLSI